MMSVVPNLFCCILIDIILLLFFLFVGHLVLSMFKRNDSDNVDNVYNSIFCRLLVGCVSTIVLYAMIRSICRTTLVAVVFLAICYLICSRRNKLVDLPSWFKQVTLFRFNLTVLLLLIVFLSIPFAAFVGLLMDVNGNMVFASNDYAFYAGIAGRLADSGMESTYLYDIDGCVPTLSFYHYFELWFAALVYAVFGIGAEYAFMLCAIPVLIAITILGAMGYVYSKTGKGLVSVIIALILLFIVPISIPLKHISISYDMVNALLLSKYAIVYALLVATLIEIRSKHWVEVYFLLSLISVVYLPTLPAIICVWISMSAFSIVKKKWDRKIVPFALIPIAVIPALYLLFGQSGNDLPEETGLLFQLKSVYGDKASYVRYVKCLLKGAIGFCLSYLVWFLLMLHPKCRLLAKRHWNIVVVLFIAIILTMVGTTILYFMENSGQLISVFWQSVLAVGIFSLIVECLVNVRYAPLFALLLVLCGGYFAITDVLKKTWKSYEMNQMYKAIEKEVGNKDASFAYVKNAADYKLYDAQFQLWSKNITYTIPLCEIRRFNSHYYPICLSIYEIPTPETPRDWLYYGTGVHISPFWLYVSQNDLSDNVDEAKLSFLSSNKIQYLIASPDNEWMTKVLLPMDTIIQVDGIEDCLIRLNWDK